MFNLDPKTKKLVKLAGKIFLGIVVASTVAWFLVINPYLIAQEKKRFEAASAELDKLAQEIQAKIGAAQEVKDKSSCDRPNLKFAEGSLSCSASRELVYSVANSDDANDYLTRVSSHFNNPLRQGPLTEKITFEPDVKRSAQIIYQDTDSYSSLSCSVSYEYYSQNSKLENIEPIFKVILNCFGSARSEHFPLAD